jgi:hypothetical protein
VKASDIPYIVIGLALLGLILYRQLQRRPIRSASNNRLPLILGIIGVVELVGFLGKGHHGATIYAALLGSLVLAAVFGAIRAATTHVWLEGGQPWRQGNWLTAVLWVVSIAAHLGYDYLVDGHGSLAGLGSASLTLYLAVTLVIQSLILNARAQRIDGGAAGGAAGGGIGGGIGGFGGTGFGGTGQQDNGTRTTPH